MFDPAVFKGSDKDTVQRIQAYVVGSCKDAGFFLKPTSSCKQYKVGRLLAVLYFACEHNAPPVATSNQSKAAIQIDVKEKDTAKSLKKKKPSHTSWGGNSYCRCAVMAKKIASDFSYKKAHMVQSITNKSTHTRTF